MALATATPEGRPSVRMVLMKGFDERGFVFYTNYGSRKALELEANPRAALLFHWPGRQVRIEGRMERVSREESVAYARSRPRGSQLSALASPQSRPIESRRELEQRVADLARQYPGEIPVSRNWGGFRVVAESYEFWEHRPDRLHDRIRYTGAGDGWLIERLGP
jgi:pyridoxamine 5'-phosphate oxidase